MMLRLLSQSIIGNRIVVGLQEAYRRYSEVQRLYLVGNRAKIKELSNPLARRNRANIRRFRNRHVGKRCFIVGNGPSLKNTDLSNLKNEFSIGTNRIYLIEKDAGFRPTYYVAINKYVIEQCADDIAKLSMPCFLNLRHKDKRFQGEHFMYVTDEYDQTLGFSRDVSERIWEGATVTYAAMQIAHYMGFHEVYLIGVDHSFKCEGRPHQLVESTGDDPNHFNPEYFGKGFQWQLPDLETSETAYTLARYTYKETGRILCDATAGGCLKVFPRVNFDDLFRLHR